MSESIPDLLIYVTLFLVNTIELLAESVINQIAAGEVIENPASVVKELVENSVDAEASEIIIEIEAGGLQKIKVQDNGCGMSSRDAKMSLLRHATSKIKSVEDLEVLKSKGFRGEALASIDSISDLTIVTSNGFESTKLYRNSFEPAARNKGTTIEVRNLFLNAPARLKFQKSPSACASNVFKGVQQIALAHPEISFRLISNGKNVLDLSASDLKERVKAILGEFPHELDSSSIKAFLSSPSEGNLTRRGQYFFINNRPIQSPFLSKAVKQGYGTRISENLYPSFVLFLELSPDKFDVNVHPQKKEVRFQDESEVFSLVQKAISEAFGSENHLILPWEFTPPSAQFLVENNEGISCTDADLFPLDQEQALLDPISYFHPVCLLGSYLLVEEVGLKLIDLKGAEARILYEQAEKSFIEMQQLLVPLELKVDSSDEFLALCLELGIEARVLHPRLLVIDAIPSMLDPLEVEKLLHGYQKERKKAVSFSRLCRQRLKKYNLEEARAIYKKLITMRDPLYDPLGRKIQIPFEERKIETWFQ